MATPLTKLIYHVTPYETAKAIIDCGYLDPLKSQGKQPVTWYVSTRMISWAIAHCLQRHNCQIEDLVVFTCKTPAEIIKRSNRRGIYYCAEKVNIIEMSSAAIVLQREERYVFVPGSRRKSRTTPHW